MDVGHQAPGEARAQAVVQVAHRLRDAVARQHDLLVGLVQRVEGVEKFFLGGVAPGDELHVVYQQHVHCTIAPAEFVGRALANGLDDLVGEALGGHIGDRRPAARARCPMACSRCVLPRPTPP